MPITSSNKTGPVSAFRAGRLIASGALIVVALAVKAAESSPMPEPILVFNDATGEIVDLDLRGGSEDIAIRLGRYSELAPAEAALEEGAGDSDEAQGRRGRGRPKLGVMAKEVTLLPRHWEWLAAQRGGASAALRRLVDLARRGETDERTQRRSAHEAAYRFMAAIGGDWPGFEEAARALFADDQEGFRHRLAEWPDDARAYALRLAFGARAGGSEPPSSLRGDP